MLNNIIPYWNCLQKVVQNVNEYSTTKPKECEAFLCYKLLLERPEVQYLLKNGNALRLLRLIISKDEFVELLFEMNAKNKWGLEKQFVKTFKTGKLSELSELC